MVTIHPQAFFWVPVVFFKNLSNWISGIQPDQDAGFRPSDLHDARLTQRALAAKAQFVQPLLGTNKYDASVLLHGTLLVLAGLQDRAFAERMYKALLEFQDKSWSRPWVKRIETKITTLGVSPDAVKSTVVQRKTLQLPYVQFALSLLPLFFVAGVLNPYPSWLRLIFGLLALISAPLTGYGIFKIRSSADTQIPWAIRKKEAGAVGFLASSLRICWLPFLLGIFAGAITPSAFARHLFPQATIPSALQLVLFALLLLFVAADVGTFIALWLPDDAFKKKRNDSDSTRPSRAT
jgi:hypothetical protein